MGVNLPRDYARCIGKLGFDPAAPHCDKRDQCARYGQITRDREQGDVSRVVHIQHCEDGGLFLPETAP